MLLFAFYIYELWNFYFEVILAIAVGQFEKVPGLGNIRSKIAINVYDQRGGQVLRPAMCFDVVLIDKHLSCSLFHLIAKRILKTLLDLQINGFEYFNNRSVGLNHDIFQFLMLQLLRFHVAVLNFKLVIKIWNWGTQVKNYGLCMLILYINDKTVGKMQTINKCL